MNRATAFLTVFGLALLVSAGFLSGFWRWECDPTDRKSAGDPGRALDDLEPVNDRSGVSLNVQWDLVQRAKRAIGGAAQVAERLR